MHWCHDESRFLCWALGALGSVATVAVAYIRWWWPAVKRFFGGGPDA